MGTITLTRANWKKVGKAAMWVAGSGAITAVLQFAPFIDFGEYSFVVAGVLNIIGVFVEKYVKSKNVTEGLDVEGNQ